MYNSGLSSHKKKMKETRRMENCMKHLKNEQNIEDFRDSIISIMAWHSTAHFVVCWRMWRAEKKVLIQLKMFLGHLCISSSYHLHFLPLLLSSFLFLCVYMSYFLQPKPTRIKVDYATFWFYVDSLDC